MNYCARLNMSSLLLQACFHPFSILVKLEKVNQPFSSVSYNNMYLAHSWIFSEHKKHKFLQIKKGDFSFNSKEGKRELFRPLLWSPILTRVYSHFTILMRKCGEKNKILVYCRIHHFTSCQFDMIIKGDF